MPLHGLDSLLRPAGGVGGTVTTCPVGLGAEFKLVSEVHSSWRILGSPAS